MLNIKMVTYTITPLALALLASSGTLLAGGKSSLSDLEKLGENIFFDESLSINQNQACVTCHAPEVGFTGPLNEFNEAGAVYEGSIPGEFGERKPPSSAYASLAPRFYADFGNRLVDDPEAGLDTDPLFVGGNFSDGRATGWKLGNPAADQSQGPFLNPVEQALPDRACVVYRVCEGDYSRLFDEVWSATSCTITWPNDINATCSQIPGEVALSPPDRNKVNAAYDRIALSIAAFEGSAKSNAFSSKIDAHRADRYDFTAEEILGRDIFRGKGKCANCHVGAPGPGSEPPLFTDFTFDNLGVPVNPFNPAFVTDNTFRDVGLSNFLATVSGFAGYETTNKGKHKVPTLRNVAKGSCETEKGEDKWHGKKCITKAYMHNGYFKSLKGVVHFYNTRDNVDKTACEDLGIVYATEAEALANNCWPAPEVAENVNTDELGDLGLTEEEEDALVVWMQAMSDGFFKRKNRR